MKLADELCYSRVLAAKWNEAQHPRQANGEFAPEEEYDPAGSRSVQLADGSYTGGEPGQYVRAPDGQIPHFSQQEKATLEAYAEGDLSVPGQEHISPQQVEQHVVTLDRIFARSRTAAPLTLWRGLSGSYGEKVEAALRQGADSIQPRTYQSTSTDQSVAHNFLRSTNMVLQIHVPKGTPAIAPAHAGAGFGYEQEIVLPRQTQYHVQRLYRSNGRSYAEVTAQVPDS